MSETWSKEWCPKCGKPNWLGCGDPEDITSGVDFDALECWNCDYQWLLYPDEYKYTGKEEPYLERGRKSPDALYESPKKEWDNK